VLPSFFGGHRTPMPNGANKMAKTATPQHNGSDFNKNPLE
jgi:hypothetical protein